MNKVVRVSNLEAYFINYFFTLVYIVVKRTHKNYKAEKANRPFNKNLETI